MDDAICLMLLLFTLICLGVHFPPAPDLKPYVTAHKEATRGYVGIR